MANERANLFNLPEIRSVSVDKNLTYEEKLNEYVRQLKGDPYHFRCGKYSIKVSYRENGLSFNDSLRKLISTS